MDIIHRRGRKINGFAEMFTSKPTNISMKRKDMDFFDDEGYEEEPYINEDEEAEG